MSELWITALVTLWVIVAAQTMLLIGVLRQLGAVQLRLGNDPGALITKEGLERDTEAPDFEGENVLDGRRIRLTAFRGRRVLLFFVSTTCVSCKELIPHINAMAKEWPEIVTLAVCYGTGPATSQFAHLYHLTVPTIADETNEIAARYDVQFTPFAYLLDEDGRVRIRGVANNWPQLEGLIQEEGTLRGNPLSGVVATHLAG